TWAPGYKEGEISCAVTISLNEQGKVVIGLTDRDGIEVLTRDSTSDRYEVAVVHELRHPVLSLEKFLRTTHVALGEISSSVKRTGLRTSERWSLRLANLGRPSAFIQMDYDKSATWAFFDSGLVSVPDATGCYQLVKVQ